MVRGRERAHVCGVITAAGKADPVVAGRVVPCGGELPRVGGASVTAGENGPALREPLSSTMSLIARLDELLFTTGEGAGAEDFMFGSPMLILTWSR